jgi:capsid protein
MARYEVGQNNSYGVGIAQTLVNDTIGTGPRLQMQFENEKLNARIEQEFSYWVDAINLRDKLATLRMSKLIDGEALCRTVNNMGMGEPISLDYQLIECDQLSTPDLVWNINPQYVDGVHLDRFGNPVSYDILDHHPGSDYWTNTSWSYQTYDRSQIVHIFRRDRPGQHRGISEFASALPLFALLRRFTLATVTAAETAASVSQVISTDAPIPEELEAEYAAATFDKYMESIPIDRNSATVLPNQWSLKQFSAEHPTTTYRMFKQELINEIARVLSMPRNIAACDSSDYNYASGRLDHMTYQKAVGVEQSYLAKQVLDRMFSDWLLESALSGLLPKNMGRQVLAFESQFGKMGLTRRIPHTWYWDGFKDADQTKEADAQRTRLSSGTSHRSAEYAAQGLDVNVEDTKAAQSYGVSVEEYRKMVAMSIFTNGNLLPMDAPNGEQATKSEPAATEDDQSNS